MAQEIIIRLRDVSTGKTFTFPANPESISGTLGGEISVIRHHIQRHRKGAKGY